MLLGTLDIPAFSLYVQNYFIVIRNRQSYPLPNYLEPTGELSHQSGSILHLDYFTNINPT